VKCRGGRPAALLGSALWCLGAAPPPEPSGVAQAIYDGLGLGILSGDPTDLVVTLPLDAPPPWPQLAQALTELLLARGHRVVNGVGDDRQLVELGVEWRLSLGPDGADGGVAHWTRIDPGLWNTGVEQRWSSARYVIRWPTEGGQGTPPVEPPPSPSSTTARLGVPAPLGTTPQPAWALAACGPGGGPEWLFALEEFRLVAYRLDRGRLETVAELDLSAKEKAARPTRAPLANVVCAGPSDGGLLLGFGHGRLKDGGRVVFDPNSGAKLRFRTLGPLPGIPIAKVAARWLVGLPDQGRHRYGSWAWVNADGTLDAAPLPGPLFQAGASAPGNEPPGPILGLGPELRLSSFDHQLTPRPTQEQSGLGWCSRRINGAELLIVSSPLRGEERVGLAGSKERRPLDGPVLAGALGHFAADRWSAIWAVDRGPRGAAYYWAPLELP
jgi:hypothetical protein